MKNLRKIKGNWYYRLKIWNGVKEKETPIPLKTKNKTDAIRRAKIVLDNADDLKSGVIQGLYIDLGSNHTSPTTS